MPVQHSPALARNTNDTTFSAALVAKLFDAAPGSVVEAPQGTGGNYIIARVTGIAHPQTAGHPAALCRGARAQISQQAASDFSIALRQCGATQQGVKVNQKLLQQADRRRIVTAMSPGLRQLRARLRREDAAGCCSAAWSPIWKRRSPPFSSWARNSKGRDNAFLLESVQGGETRGRYSIIGLKPDLIWRCRGGMAEINRHALQRRGHLRAPKAPSRWHRCAR